MITISHQIAYLNNNDFLFLHGGSSEDILESLTSFCSDPTCFIYFKTFPKTASRSFNLFFLFVKFKFCLVLSSNCENILVFKSMMNWGSLSFGFKQFCMDFITCITIEHATNSAPPRVMVWTSSWVYNLWTPSITIWSESVRIRLSRYFPLTVFQNSILHLLRSSKYFLDTDTNYLVLTHYELIWKKKYQTSYVQAISLDINC